MFNWKIAWFTIIIDYTKNVQTKLLICVSARLDFAVPQDRCNFVANTENPELNADYYGNMQWSGFGVQNCNPKFWSSNSDPLINMC